MLASERLEERIGQNVAYIEVFEIVSKNIVVSLSILALDWLIVRVLIIFHI